MANRVNRLLVRISNQTLTTKIKMSNDQAQFSLPSEFISYFQVKHNSFNNLPLEAVADISGVTPDDIMVHREFTSRELQEKLETSNIDSYVCYRYGFNALATWIVVLYFAHESSINTERARRFISEFGLGFLKTVFNSAREKKSVKYSELTLEYLKENVSITTQIYSLPDGELKELLLDIQLDILNQNYLLK